MDKEKFSELRKRLEKVARRLSEKNIIVLNESSGNAYTNGQIIYLPIEVNHKIQHQNDQYLTNFSEDTLFGLAGHESFHIRAHSFTKKLTKMSTVISEKYGINYRLSRYIINITEDYRVNTWLKNSYRGFYEDLKNHSDDIFREGLRRNNKLELLQQIFSIYSTKSEELHEIIKNSEIISLDKKTIKELENQMKELENNPSPEYGVIAANKLAELYDKLREKEIQKEENKKQGNKEEKNQINTDQNETNKEYDKKEQFDNKQEDAIDSKDDMTKPSKQPDIKPKSAEEIEINNKIGKTILKIYNDYPIDETELKEAKERSEKEIEESKHSKNKKKKEDIKNFKTETGRNCKIIDDKQDVISKRFHNTENINIIEKRNRATINQLRRILSMKTEKTYDARGYKSGRMNRDIIRTIASCYENTNCFSRREIEGKGRMSILLDLSGSMKDHNRIHRLKEAIIILAKALKDTTELRITGYTTGFGGSVNIVFKDFDQELDNELLNAIDTRREGSGTPTGLALHTEITYLKHKFGDIKKRIPLLLITDGDPGDSAFLKKTVVKAKNIIQLFGICVNYRPSEEMEKLFGNNITRISKIDETRDKLINISKKIVKAF